MDILGSLATPVEYLAGMLIVGALLFLLASFVFGRGEEMAQMPPDVSPVVLPASRAVRGRDLRRLKLSVVLRGYRMSEVDWVLDQVARQIDERDEEIARLRSAASGARAEPEPEPEVEAEGGDGDGPATDGPAGGGEAQAGAEPAAAGAARDSQDATAP